MRLGDPACNIGKEEVLLLWLRDPACNIGICCSTKIQKKKHKARPILTFKVDECFEHGELNEALAQHGSDVGIAVSWVQILCDWVTEVRGDHLGALGPKSTTRP